MLPNLFTTPIGAADILRLAAIRKQSKKPTSGASKTSEGKISEPNEPPPKLHAIRRIALIGVHHCPECDRETELNLGQFVESVCDSKDLLRTRCVRAADWTQWAHLPRSIEILQVDHRLCPRCLGRMPIDNPAQMRLFA